MQKTNAPEMSTKTVGVVEAGEADAAERPKSSSTTPLAPGVGELGSGVVGDEGSAVDEIISSVGAMESEPVGATKTIEGRSRMSLVEEALLSSEAESTSLEVRDSERGKTSSHAPKSIWHPIPQYPAVPPLISSVYTCHRTSLWNVPVRVLATAISELRTLASHVLRHSTVGDSTSTVG
jgi:hypothetical protein